MLTLRSCLASASHTTPAQTSWEVPIFQFQDFDFAQLFVDTWDILLKFFDDKKKFSPWILWGHTWCVLWVVKRTDETVHLEHEA